MLTRALSHIRLHTARARVRCQRRLAKEYSALSKSPLPHIIVNPNPRNILELHYVISGPPDSPYKGGQYWGYLLFPKEYPMKPPGVVMETPSGRFSPGRRICLSMSDYHPETWNPMWSVGTILTGLFSFMLESSPTLGSSEYFFCVLCFAYPKIFLIALAFLLPYSLSCYASLFAFQSSTY